jgi:hypothetical protein
MLKLKKPTKQQLLMCGAMIAIGLLATTNGAWATPGAATGGTLGDTTASIATNAAQLPRIVAGLAMPVGIFLLILGGLNLVKLGKDPNAEEMRNVIFKLLAGVFVLTLNWIIPYFRTTLGLGADTATNSAAQHRSAKCASI